MALLLAADALTLFNVKTSHIVYMHIKKMLEFSVLLIKLPCHLKNIFEVGYRM